jgi:hypothetical protein
VRFLPTFKTLEVFKKLSVPVTLKSRHTSLVVLLVTVAPVTIVTSSLVVGTTPPIHVVVEDQFPPVAAQVIELAKKCIGKRHAPKHVKIIIRSR